MTSAMNASVSILDMRHMVRRLPATRTLCRSRGK
jgi:hypothetical protein